MIGRWFWFSVLFVGALLLVVLTAEPNGRVAGVTTEYIAPDASTLDPLSIEYLRAMSFAGSELTIIEELAASDTYSPSIVEYTSQGLIVQGLITIPRGEMPQAGWPAVVFAHGDIDPERYSPTQQYIHYVEGVAREGFVVFVPDYRGHGDSQGEAVNAYATQDYTIDVINAVESLAKADFINPQAIGIWAHSTGGHIALRAMTVEPKIKAGVMWGGVVGSYEELITLWPRDWEEHTEELRGKPETSDPRRRWRSYLLERYGTFLNNPREWEAISTTTYLDSISGPVQLHHAATDEWVPSILSRQMHERLSALGKTSELYIYENDVHDLTNNFELALERTVNFFNRTLLGLQ